MTRSHADEQMRNDPVRRAAVRHQIEQRQAAFREAREHLAKAANVLHGLDRLSDDPLLDRCREAVFRAESQLVHDADMILAEPTDTYIGNKAAFGSPHGWTPTLGDLCAPALTPQAEVAQ